MSRRAAVLLVLLGCGAGPGALPIRARIEGLAAGEVASVAAYAIGPRRTDDDKLIPCSVLLDGTEPTADPGVPVLSQAEGAVSGTAPSLRLDDVPEGPGLRVLVRALAAGGEPVGVGCEDDVTVEGERTVEVLVTVYPLSQE